MSLNAQRQLTRIGVVQQRSGTLVQHVRIDATRPQEQNAALPHGALSSEPGKFTIQLCNLLFKFLLRPQATIAGIFHVPGRQLRRSESKSPGRGTSIGAHESLLSFGTQAVQLFTDSLVVQ